MRWLPRSSLRMRLTLLIVVSMLPVMILTVWTYVEERNLRLKHIMSELHLVSRFASETQERFLLSTQQLLVALSKMASLRTPDSNACSSELNEILSRNPTYANIGAIRPDGSLFCSAEPVGASEGFADHHWFRSSLMARDTSVGMSQAGDDAAVPILYFSHPVADAAGNLQLVAFAAMDLANFNQLAVQMQLPGTAEFLMVSKAGAVLAYWPDPEKFVGKSLAATPLVEIIQANGRGETDVEGLDGVRRLYAFTPLSSTVDTYLYVGIGIPKALVYSDANRGLSHRLIALGLISSVALILVWTGTNVFVVRRVQVLVSAVQRLLSEHLQTRTSLCDHQGELDDLAQACDDLAEAVKGHFDQMRGVETRYHALVEQLPSITYTAEERERQRLAIDLHDTIGQTLAITRIKLGMLKEAAAASEYAHSIQEIRALIIDAIQGTKSLIHRMSSPILHEMGLEAALHWLADQIRKEHGLEVRCRMDVRDTPLDHDLRSFLFRAVRELLINVVKHSRARHATITITTEDEAIRISVSDDGVGFDTTGIDTRGHRIDGFGLFSIRERLGHLNGSIEIESRPNESTTVTLTAPLSPTASTSS